MYTYVRYYNRLPKDLEESNTFSFPADSYSDCYEECIDRLYTPIWEHDYRFIFDRNNNICMLIVRSFPSNSASYTVSNGKDTFVVNLFECESIFSPFIHGLTSIWVKTSIVESLYTFNLISLSMMHISV